MKKKMMTVHSELSIVSAREMDMNHPPAESPTKQMFILPSESESIPEAEVNTSKKSIGK